MAEDTRIEVNRAQHALAFLDQTRTDPGVSNQAGKFTVLKHVGPADILKAVAPVSAVQPALRARIVDSPTEPGNVTLSLSAEAPWPVQVVNADEEDATEAVRRAIRRPFDLATAPMFRSVLIHRKDGSTEVNFVGHHLVIDGLGMWRLGTALVNHFLGTPSGGCTEGTLDDHARTLNAFAKAEQRFLEEFKETGQEAQLLDEAIGWEGQVLALERLAPTDTSLAGDSLTVSLPLSPIVDAAVSARVTPFVLLYAAWVATLSRMSASEDVLTGHVVSNAPRQGAMTLGNFVNLLPFHFRDVATTPLVDLPQTVAAASKSVRLRARYPYSALAGGLGRTEPLLRHYFSLVGASPTAPGAWLLSDGQTRKGRSTVRSNLRRDQEGEAPLVLEASIGSAVALTFKYRTAVLEPADVALVARTFCHVLDRLLSGDRQLVNQMGG